MRALVFGLVTCARCAPGKRPNRTRFHCCIMSRTNSETSTPKRAAAQAPTAPRAGQRRQFCGDASPVPPPSPLFCTNAGVWMKCRKSYAPRSGVGSSSRTSNTSSLGTLQTLIPVLALLLRWGFALLYLAGSGGSAASAFRSRNRRAKAFW